VVTNVLTFASAQPIVVMYRYDVEILRCLYNHPDGPASRPGYCLHIDGVVHDYPFPQMPTVGNELLMNRMILVGLLCFEAVE
jgi:hypothetical protein